MEALLRDQERKKQALTQVRPPLASQTNVIDLTTDDAFGPIFSKSQPSKAALHNGIGSSSFRPLSKSTNSWQLPGRSKHVGPPKVKMLDESFNAARPPAPSHSTPPRISTAESQNGLRVLQFDQTSSTSNASIPSQGERIAQSVDLERDAIDDEEPPPPDFGYGDVVMSSAERDQQLQDMLSSMINPIEAGDIDFERAKKVEGLKCDLMPHQVAGVIWMKEREGGRFKGGILADDMGLGKTVQTIALILSNSATTPDRTIDSIRTVPGEISNQKKSTLHVDVPPEKILLKSKTSLILAPLAVIRQWEREANEKTRPALRVLVHHGSARAKMASTFAKYDVVVTTYTTAASEWANHSGGSTIEKKKKKTTNKKVTEDDSDHDSISVSNGDSSSEEDVRSSKAKKAPAPLFEAQWLRIVLDEAQNIKNHRTKASLACAALSRNALSKWCLSGTPIQNDAMEMFSLIRFLGIPPFNEYSHFKDKIADPLKSPNQNRVNWGMKRLCVVLRTIMLRRTKETMHDGKPLITLPSRIVNIVSSDFDNENERYFYKDLESQVKKKFEDAEDEGQKVNHMTTLLMLLRLRQACSHPLLLSRHVKSDAAAASAPASIIQNGVSAEDGIDRDDDDDGLANMLAGLSVVTKSCDRCQAILTKEESKEKHCTQCIMSLEQEKSRGINWTGESSTKIRLMLKLLEDIRDEKSGEKTIIFSQFTSFLDLVEPFLQKGKHKYVRYDGSMRADERERNLEKIRNDESVKVIIISFMAGSTGLNLTCCSRVILMDLWWNPQLEEQAFDRSHRLGQTRPVQIYKLTIKKSVEERILELQAKKRALAKAALEGSKFSKANKLDKKELMYLFSGAPIA